MPKHVNDLSKAIGGLQTAINNYEDWALAGSKVVVKEVDRLGKRNLLLRKGGGKYKRSVASIFTSKGLQSWSVTLRTPWMGMEWGGLTTWVWGKPFGTEKRNKAGFQPMWAPWHRKTEQGVGWDS